MRYLSVKSCPVSKGLSKGFLTYLTVIVKCRPIYFYQLCNFNFSFNTYYAFLNEPLAWKITPYQPMTCTIVLYCNDNFIYKKKMKDYS